jgi:hypothetical protein
LILQAFAGSYFLSWIWSPKIVAAVGMPAPDPPRMHSQRQLWSVGIWNYHFTSIYSLKQVSCNQDYLVLRENNWERHQSVGHWDMSSNGRSVYKDASSSYLWNSTKTTTWLVTNNCLRGRVKCVCHCLENMCSNLFWLRGCCLTPNSLVCLQIWNWFGKASTI